jgi:hypothetical protein
MLELPSAALLSSLFEPVNNVGEEIQAAVLVEDLMTHLRQDLI